ncbi:PAS domain-containing protein [Rubrivivax benzoatilyticus]|uniref:histidine kinase n=1 Tax=Rubrivivax benzoatilyticus TaxID=316997 RepID=A0ABX0I2X8_9BURK|nr:PAS domain-containing protein [Rubrivivax benzoatilyticus]EGJ11634.1 multi-sensor hybrid histidine kinase [Rubrivivax benzoatilyticus JA2 = ATCC BAA-35]NHL00169.1 PAS domain-containing protein [Rubrivivax benzoatilyticus]NHL26052.1 PAS domain-containing protein [Rubrivivax benzoatilyticus]
MNAATSTDTGHAGTARRRERLALAALLGIVALALFVERRSAHETTLVQESARLQGQAIAARDVLAQQLRAVHAALVELSTTTAGTGRLHEYARVVPGVTELLTLDAAGRVRASSGDTAPGTQVAGLPPQPRAGLLHLLPPAADAQGAWRMLMLLPVHDGWLAASFDAGYARVVQQSVRYAPDMRTVLAHGGGRIVMAEPPMRDIAAVDLARAGGAFGRHRDSGLDTSVQQGPSTITGEQRMFLMASLRAPLAPVEPPLLLTVSRSREQILAGWRRQTLLDTALFALAALLSTGAMALMHRRQRRALERERQEAERLGLVVSGADLVLWDVDLVSNRVSVNARWHELLGLPATAGERDTAEWAARVHPEDLPGVVAQRDRHLEGHLPRFEALYRLRHEDGRWIWVLARGAVTARGARGEPQRMTGTLLDVTERTEAQRALERSEQQLAVTLQSLGDAVVATDRDSRVTRMNLAAERLSGWPAAEAAGRPLDEVLPLFDQGRGHRIAGPVATVLARGEVVELANDTMLLTRDGRRLYIEDSAAPIRGRDGTIDGVVMVFRDVSERYEARRALRERERLLAGITDALPGPVARLDIEGRYLFANAAYRDWYGVDPARLVGRPMREVLGEAAHAHVAPQLARVRRGETVRFEMPLTTADGVARALFVTLVPDRNADGSMQGHFVLVVDISDIKRAEDARRASERRARALLENLLIGVVVHEPDLSVREANATALKWFGAADLAGLRRRIADGQPQLVDDDGTPLPPARLPVAQALREGRRVADLLVGLKQDGQPIRWALCDAVPLGDERGGIEAVVVTFADITSRREAERLEQRLRDAQKLEAIGTLAGGIAHDFNNMLAGILGRLARAREDLQAGRPAEGHLDEAVGAGLRAVALVRQILAFSRGETGQRELQPLEPVLRDTAAMLRAMVPAGVRLETRLPPQPVGAVVDATQLQQVLMNLATNAWHALPPDGGGRIEIGLEPLSAAAAAALQEPALAAGAAAHLWVRDNGCGIPEEIRGRLFDPFFTTKPVGKGTGLGLSVVHGIVAAHGGAIRVDSTPGAGSVFHVYLPSCPLTQAPPAAAAAPAPPPPGPAHGARVLLVDDDAIVASVAEQLLLRAGCVVRVCHCGSEAIAALDERGEVFDIVVTDHNMPDASGFEVARRAAAARPRLPVVLGSGLVDDTLREQAAAAGVRAVLPKEAYFERLVPLVGEVLAAGPGAALQPPVPAPAPTSTSP